MRVNIAKSVVDDSYLYKKVSEYSCENWPYVIMCQRTLDTLLDMVSMYLVETEHGYEFAGYTVLVDDNLRYGEVEIR